MYGIVSDAGMGLYPHRMVLALQISGWGFHTVWGGIDPGNHRFRPRFIEVIDVWNDL